MSQLQNEVDANQAAFFSSWTAQTTKNWKTLETNSVYKASYRRITSLQAIKTHLVIPHFSKGSAAFFLEAHNDALVSHVNASVGAWRSALQALRSSIENTLCAIYYNEHPVELELWSKGQFRIGASDLLTYGHKHPRLSALKNNVSGLASLASEYATLSKAVHGSAANFRMTDPVGSILLWSTDPVKASMWSTREKNVVEDICLLMSCLNHTRLDGTKLAPLRSVLGFAVSASKRTELKKQLKITIVAP